MDTDHRAGPAPARSTNSLTLSWGVVPLHLAIYAGTDKGSQVTRHEFTPDGHAIGRQAYDKVTGQPYDGDVVKQVEVTKDRYVALSDDEIELVTGGVVKDHADIETFIPLASIGREYLVSDVKQVRAASKVPGAEKPFALLLDAMAEEKVAALFMVTLRSVARYAALTPDGDLLLLHFADQVRPPRPLPSAEFTDRERDMARTLIHDVIGVDTPVLVNETGQKVMAYVASKLDGAEPITEVTEVVAAPSDSLEAMLAAAVEAAQANKVDETEAAAEAPAKPKRAPRKTAAA